MQKNEIAITIESISQFKLFRNLCNKNGLTALAHPKIKNLHFPHYQMIVYAGNNVYSLYNERLKDGNMNLVELGYVPLPFSEFRKNVNKYIGTEEKHEE